MHFALGASQDKNTVLLQAMPSKEALLAAAERLRRLYQDADSKLLPRVKASNVSCTTGCYGCCLQAIRIGLPEAVLLAETIRKDPAWYDIAKEMARLGYVQECVRSDSSYFFLAKPCALLRDHDKLCRAYEARPIACRFYFVKTDAKLCYPSPTGKPERVLLLDLRTVGLSVYQDGIAALGGLCMSPLPLATLHVMYALADIGTRETLRPLLTGLPTPIEWSVRDFSGGKR